MTTRTKLDAWCDAVDLLLGVQVMLWVADYSLARPWPLPGYSGVVRYVLDGTMPGKGVSKVEYDQLLARGMSVALVMETGTQPALGGTQAGIAHARAAFGQADYLGFPKDRPIYFVAEDPTRVAQAQWTTVEQYFAGVNAVVPVSRIGAYGSAPMVDHLIAMKYSTYGWAVETWGTMTPRIALMQCYNPQPGAPSNLGGTVDPNEVLHADWGQHDYTGVPLVTGGVHDMICHDIISGGIWATTANGAVYTWGGAPYYGGINALPAAQRGTAGSSTAPVVGIAAYKNGYVQVTLDSQDTTGDPFRYYPWPATDGRPDISTVTAGKVGPVGPPGAAGPTGPAGVGGTVDQQVRDALHKAGAAFDAV